LTGDAREVPVSDPKIYELAETICFRAETGVSTQHAPACSQVPEQLTLSAITPASMIARAARRLKTAAAAVADVVMIS